MKKNYFLLLGILMLAGTAAQAQQATDVLLRQQLTLAYKTAQRWTVSGKYFLYLHDNATRFDKSVLGLELNYKIFPWLEAGVEYRYGMNHEQDGHEFRYSLEGEYSPKKSRYELKWRTLLEQSTDYFDRDYLAVHPVKNVWRNRLMAAYKIHKKTDIYVLTEFYLGWKNSTSQWQQTNYGIGADYQLKRRHSFNAEVQYRDYHYKKTNADIVRIDVGYKLSLGYQKPKKKKKGKRAAE